MGKAKVTAPINRAALTWARTTVGMPMDISAKKIGVKPEKLTAWESGPQAQVTGAIIVTQEKPAGSQAKKMKIPDVASAMDLGYINMLQFVKEMGWVFR